MRTRQELELVDALLACGLNDCQIARATGIPRGTVKDWRRGRRPDFDKHPTYASGMPPDISLDREPAYAYLLGLYLGDGWISKMPRTYRLRIALDGIYPEIVANCKAAMEEVLPNRVSVRQTDSRAVEVSAYSNAWPHLFPQHGPGLKHHRPILLEPWQVDITHREPEALVRGLIHSDGSRGPNTVHIRGKTYAYPRYYFSNRSDDIRGIFCEHLDLLGIPWRRMNRWNISIARREGVAQLDAFIGPKR